MAYGVADYRRFGLSCRRKTTSKATVRGLVTFRHTVGRSTSEKRRRLDPWRYIHARARARARARTLLEGGALADLTAGEMRVGVDVRQEAEASRNSLASAVSPEGSLLDHETLALRVHPPNVVIDNHFHPTETVITVDSANRPGTLVEVVQCLTENNLVVKGAQISSLGGWFVDEFNVTELGGGKVVDPRKLAVIKKVLDVEYDSGKKATSMNNEDAGFHCTVFELAGKDRHGLLDEVTNLLTREGLDVRSLAAWTQKYGQGAIVIFALYEGKPIQDSMKIASLRMQLYEHLNAKGIVNIKAAKGLPHHERRLHKLLLEEVERDWNDYQKERRGSSEGIVLEVNSSLPPVSKAAETTQVKITYLPRLNYWRVTIRCKDRPKLLFDTLCTLVDMDFDVFHASVCDGNNKTAFQDFYVRPRVGDTKFNVETAAKVEFMLHASINRRFPRGLKVHVWTMDQIGLLAKLTTIFRNAHMSVTRAKVRTLSNERGLPTGHAVHTFYLVDEEHKTDVDATKAVSACTAAGGIEHKALAEDRLPQGGLALSSGQFYFAVSKPDFLNRALIGSPSSALM